MKLPRDLSGAELAKALSRIGYRITRKTGSHLRLTLDTPPQHHITIPAHDVPLFDIGDSHSKSPLGYDIWRSPGVITNALGAQVYIDLRLSKVIGIGAIDDPFEPQPTETFPDGYVPPPEVLARSRALID